MRAKVLILMAVTIVVGSACARGGTAPDRTTRPLPSETLLLQTPSGPISVESPSGRIVLSATGSMASPDGSEVISASSDGGSTVVSVDDPETGNVRARTSVPGDLEVRSVASGGSPVALMAPVPAGTDPWAPVPRERTRIVVVDPYRHLDARTYELDGNFEPDAFSSDGTRLFLLQYFPAAAPSLYQVTVLDLIRGKVGAVYGPLKTPTERMPGTRLAQVRAPFGTTLYTLYTSEQPGFAPHGLPVPRNAEVSFVHMLDLAQGFAHCLVLPDVFWHRPGSAEAMALSPDGGRLFVVDSGLGAVTVFDTSSFETLATVRLGTEIPNAVRTSAAVSDDGDSLFVAAGRSILRIDTASLQLRSMFEASGDVTGLGVSSEGSVYAAVGGELDVLDPSTGSSVGVVPVPTPSPILQVMTLAA